MVSYILEYWFGVLNSLLQTLVYHSISFAPVSFDTSFMAPCLVIVM